MYVLAVGVSEYKADSNFRRLRQCAHDASAVSSKFVSNAQLYAAGDGVRTLTSATEDKPTKGHIIRELRTLATQAEPDSRLMFYFSGHGHRIADALYLAPEDAWTDDDPEALVSFAKVLEILSASRAKVKIAIVDACCTGADVGRFKQPQAVVSERFLAELIAKSHGVAILASSLSDQASSTKSPDPKLSLYTYYLVKALDGVPAALQAGLLTADSLFEYLSVSVQALAKSHHAPQQPTKRISS